MILWSIGFDSASDACALWSRSTAFEVTGNDPRHCLHNHCCGTRRTLNSLCDDLSLRNNGTFAALPQLKSSTEQKMDGMLPFTLIL